MTHHSKSVSSFLHQMLWLDRLADPRTKESTVSLGRTKFYGVFFPTGSKDALRIGAELPLITVVVTCSSRRIWTYFNLSSSTYKL